MTSASTTLVPGPSGRGHRRDERGFSLLVVLFGTMLFGLLSVVLLDLALGSLRTTRSSTDSARIERAVDGAMEVAASRLQGSVDASLGAEGDCSPDFATPVVVDGVSVAIECTSVPSALDEVYTEPEDEMPIILTDTLFGFLRPDPGDVSGAILAALVGNDSPSLWVVGRDELTISGDVYARRGAFALRQGGTTPAANIVGEYSQSRLGHFGATSAGGAAPCGYLHEPYAGPGLVLLPWHAGYSISSPNPLTCSGAVPMPDITVTPPHDITPSNPTAPRAVLPDCATSGDVIGLDPGVYDRFATAQLNKWFRTTDCDNKVFHFRPGNYYFDVAGKASSDDNSRGALQFNDDTSSIVFGAFDPSSVAGPGDTVGRVCDDTQPGVSVIVSERTVFSHLKGRVSVCGPSETAVGVDPPTLYQAPYQLVGTKRWGGTPTVGAAGATSPGSPVPWTNIEAATGTETGYDIPTADYAGYGSPWNNTEIAVAPDFDPTPAEAECPQLNGTGPPPRCQPSITLNGFRNELEPSPGGDVDRALLRIRADVTTNVDRFCGIADGYCSRYHVQVTFKDGSSDGITPDCDFRVPDLSPRPGAPANATRNMARDFNTQNIDLLYGCNGKLVDAGQLEGAEITINPDLRPIPNCGQPGQLSCSRINYELDYAWLDVVAESRPPGPSSQVVNGPNNRLTYSGDVHAQSTVFGVEWFGPADVSDVPVVDGKLVGAALGSFGTGTSAFIGDIVPSNTVPPERIVRLAAYVDAGDGERLRGTALFLINDATGATHTPGQSLQVRDFAFCNEQPPAVRTPVPRCGTA